MSETQALETGNEQTREKTAVDLPVECAVDVNSIAEFLSV